MGRLAYLLAAGQGRRAGGPKAWKLWQGRPLLELQIEFLLKIFKPEEIAVSIQPDWHLDIKGIHWVAVDPEAPPLASLQALLKALPLTQWGYVYHVDMPVWEPKLFEMRADAEAVIPAFNGKRGHPVALAPTDAIGALNPQHDRLDHWLRERKTVTLELPYPCICENWNAIP